MKLPTWISRRTSLNERHLLAFAILVRSRYELEGEEIYFTFCRKLGVREDAARSGWEAAKDKRQWLPCAPAGAHEDELVAYLWGEITTLDGLSSMSKVLYESNVL